MKIYAITTGEFDSYEILGLTTSKDCAEKYAILYRGRVEMYDDIQELPYPPLWEYHRVFDSCEPIRPYTSGKMWDGKFQQKMIVYVRAETALEAREKALSLIKEKQEKELFPDS